jgi:hypothetical protein
LATTHFSAQRSTFAHSIWLQLATNSPLQTHSPADSGTYGTQCAAGSAPHRGAASTQCNSSTGIAARLTVLSASSSRITESGIDGHTRPRVLLQQPFSCSHHVRSIGAARHLLTFFALTQWRIAAWRRSLTTSPGLPTLLRRVRSLPLTPAPQSGDAPRPRSLAFAPQRSLHSRPPARRWLRTTFASCRRFAHSTAQLAQLACTHALPTPADRESSDHLVRTPPPRKKESGAADAASVAAAGSPPHQDSPTLHRRVRSLEAHSRSSVGIRAPLPLTRSSFAPQRSLRCAPVAPTRSARAPHRLRSVPSLRPRNSPARTARRLRTLPSVNMAQRAVCCSLTSAGTRSPGARQPRRWGRRSTRHAPAAYTALCQVTSLLQSGGAAPKCSLCRSHALGRETPSRRTPATRRAPVMPARHAACDLPRRSARPVGGAAEGAAHLRPHAAPNATLPTRRATAVKVPHHRAAAPVPSPVRRARPSGHPRVPSVFPAFPRSHAFAPLPTPRPCPPPSFPPRFANCILFSFALLHRSEHWHEREADFLRTLAQAQVDLDQVNRPEV